MGQDEVEISVKGGASVTFRGAEAKQIIADVELIVGEDLQKPNTHIYISDIDNRVMKEGSPVCLS